MRVEVVTDPEGVGDLIGVVREGHSVYGFPEGVFEALFATPETVLTPLVHAVVAYEGDSPVATAQFFDHRTTAYVGWVAVVPAAMGRGLGRLVTEEVVGEGLRRGAAGAGLLASPMGAPLYRKMGFEDVGRLINAYQRAG